MQFALQAETRLRQSTSVAHREIDDEVLIIPVRTDPRQGMGVYTLNRTAAMIWRLLAGEQTVAELVDVVCERFEVDEVTARRDVEACCREMLSFGAVERVEA